MPSPDPAATLRALVAEMREKAVFAAVSRHVVTRWADSIDAALSAAPARETPEKRIRYCTCIASCRGKEGLGEGWTCAMGPTGIRP